MMGADTGEERQRLTEEYRAKWDDELLVLAEDYSDLTEMAQQVLRDEMLRRGLGKPGAAAVGTATSQASNSEPAATPASMHREPPQRGFETLSGEEELDASQEFTWKTLLCECETREQAWQLGETLRRAGIDSWIEGGGAYAWEASGLRIQVAADQLEQARAIAAQPIPQDVIEQSKAELADPAPYELPHCPKCGAADPVLESADPVNTWLCEACEWQWTDPEAAPAGSGSN